MYPPISEHLLRKLTEERDPDQLVIALEANPTWKRLLASNFTGIFSLHNWVEWN